MRVKLHGDFNHPDRMVITENDYDMYIEWNPVFATYISSTAIRKSKAAIIDISDATPNVMLELGLLKSVKSEKIFWWFAKKINRYLPLT